jgi:hypothetical protein
MARHGLYGVTMLEPELNNPPADMLPELFLLGELSYEEVADDDGNCRRLAIITYERRRYLMKTIPMDRWRDRRPGE